MSLVIIIVGSWPTDSNTLLETIITELLMVIMIIIMFYSDISVRH